NAGARCRYWFHVVPSPARGRCEEPAQEGGLHATAPAAHHIAAEEVGNTMEKPIRALVAVEGLDAFDVQRAMPDDPNFELVGLTDGVDDTVRTLQTREVDVLLVACQGREDDRSLQIIDGAHRVAGDLPIIVLSTSSPNGFLRRAFDAGAADMALFPQTKEQLRFVMSKAVARAPRKGSSGPRSEHDSR